MSVINRMLSELDARRAKPPVAGDAVVAAPAGRPTAQPRRMQLLALLGAVVVSAAAFGNWPDLIPAAAKLPQPVGIAPGDAALGSSLVAAVAEPAPFAAPVSVAAPNGGVANAKPQVVAALTPRVSGATPAPSAVPQRPAAPGADALPGAPNAAPAEPAAAIDKIDKKVLALAPAQRAALAYRQASELAASGHSTQAIERAAEALKADPGHTAACQLAAVLLFEKGRFDEAAAVLQGGLALHPEHPQLSYLLARLKVETGDRAGALALLAQQDKLSAEGHALRGGIYALQGNTAQAALAYEAAARSDPANMAWWLGLGVALEADGQAQAARQAFLRAQASGGLHGELRSFVEQKLASLR